MRREEEEETEKESALPYLPCKLHLKVAAAAFYLSRFLANNEKRKRTFDAALSHSCDGYLWLGIFFDTRTISKIEQ